MDLTGLTRAALVELARARGLKATGWPKDRVLQELQALEAGGAPASSSPSPAAPADDDDVLPPIAGTGLRLTGWCALVPAWSSSHERCVARRDETVQCDCECHRDDWIKPAAPAGSQLNRFYTGESDRRGSGEDSPEVGAGAA